jgi:hypothetical protein
VKIVEELTADATGKVLLLAPPSRVKNAAKDKVVMGFSSIFWNTAWTKRQPPTTLGILCDPKHPALADFPTDFHSNWQWWYLITQAAPMILDDLPKEFRPTVQVIDDWFTARKLGLVFEANIGKAKVVVCSIALNDSNPVACQFRASLLRYMASDKFQPKQTLELESVRKLFGESKSQAVRASSEADGYEAANAFDGDPKTMWHTPWDEPAPKFPHWLTVELPKPAKVTGITCLPRQDKNPNGWIKEYVVQVSDDGKTWHEVARGEFKRDAALKTVKFGKAVEARWVKLVAVSSFDPAKPYASLAELTVIADRRD